MADAKINCPKCDGHIAYPKELAGTKITCPHCTENFYLPKKQLGVPWALAVACIFLAICVVGFVVWNARHTANRQKEGEQTASKTIDQPEDLMLTGKIFIATKEGQNIVLGDVTVALFDQHQLRKCFISHALQWSNSLAAEQTKVDESWKNYNALYKEDLDKFTAAEKQYSHVMITVPTGTPEWQQAFERSYKLGKQIKELNELKKSSAAAQQWCDAVFSRDIAWNFFNWPSYVNLLANGCDTAENKTTTTDNEGRFKFSIPASSPNVVLFAKAEREVGKKKEKYLWLCSIGTPAGMHGTNNLSDLESYARGGAGMFWFPDVQLKDKSTEVILSNHNLANTGILYFMENTNVANYMSHILVEVQVDEFKKTRPYYTE